MAVRQALAEQAEQGRAGVLALRESQAGEREAARVLAGEQQPEGVLEPGE